MNYNTLYQAIPTVVDDQIVCIIAQHKFTTTITQDCFTFTTSHLYFNYNNINTFEFHYHNYIIKLLADILYIRKNNMLSCTHNMLLNNNIIYSAKKLHITYHDNILTIKQGYNEILYYNMNDRQSYGNIKFNIANQLYRKYNNIYVTMIVSDNYSCDIHKSPNHLMLIFNCTYGNILPYYSIQQYNNKSIISKHHNNNSFIIYFTSEFIKIIVDNNYKNYTIKFIADIEDYIAVYDVTVPVRVQSFKDVLNNLDYNIHYYDRFVT